MPSSAGRELTAFVLGGGGVLGTTEVGMLKALATRGIRPDIVLGTSIGAINGAFVAADPSVAGVETLAAVWRAVVSEGLFFENPVRQAVRIAKYRTHIMSTAPLRAIIDRHLPVDTFEELPVPFQCVAARISDAAGRWFDTGPIGPAVAASCAVPGIFPPVEIDGEQYLDGGLVHSIPVGRALELGATRIFVLQVGRVEQRLEPPRNPWEVGIVAFEIARRHRFVHEMANVPPDVELHLLPSGSTNNPNVSIAQGRPSRMEERMERAYAAAAAYLEHVAPGPSDSHPPGPSDSHPPGPSDSHPPGPSDSHPPDPSDSHPPDPSGHVEK